MGNPQPARCHVGESSLITLSPIHPSDTPPTLRSLTLDKSDVTDATHERQRSHFGDRTRILTLCMPILTCLLSSHAAISEIENLATWAMSHVIKCYYFQESYINLWKCNFEKNVCFRNGKSSSRRDDYSWQKARGPGRKDKPNQIIRAESIMN